MLKLITLKKLKEDYPEVKARMVLPGGLDVNRVTLPVILSFSQDHQNTSLVAPEKTKKNKTAGFLGLFKSSPEQQEPNNATGIYFTNISKICIQVQGVHVHCIELTLFMLKYFTILETSRGPSATIPNVSITTECLPPRLQRQNTLIQSDPKNFQAMLSKEIPEASVNSNVNMDNKETLKVPVADIFPEKLQEQNYSRRKKTSSDNKSSEGEVRKKSPVRKLSTCLEPHEPVIDSLPAPVPVSPAPRSEDWSKLQ